jgi:hypothetical protein
MNLKALMVDTKSAWVNYNGLDGFEVEVVNLGREKLIALRKSCIETKFDRKTKTPVEELNEKKFIAAFTGETIKNWKGLKLKYLEELMLVDISGQDPEKELDYNAENAELLVSNSADFDTWLNAVVFDLDNFRGNGDKGVVDTTGEIPKQL